MRPDEQALHDDFRSPTFRVGERRSKWMLKGIRFPFVLFFVAAKPTPSGPGGFLLRSQCDGYAAMPPTSQLWHGAANAALPAQERPQTRSGVMEAFKDWKSCLYHPIDRLAWDHGDWPTRFPEKLWTPQKDITFLLETVYELLHCAEYVGAPLSSEALVVPSSFMDLDTARTS